MSVSTEDGLARCDGVLERIGHFGAGQPPEHSVGHVRLASHPPDEDQNPVLALAPVAVGLTPVNADLKLIHPHYICMLGDAALQRGP